MALAAALQVVPPVVHLGNWAGGWSPWTEGRGNLVLVVYLQKWYNDNEKCLLIRPFHDSQISEGTFFRL